MLGSLAHRARPPPILFPPRSLELQLRALALVAAPTRAGLGKAEAQWGLKAQTLDPAVSQPGDVGGNAFTTWATLTAAD